MMIDDILYGTEPITEPILLDLVESQALRRLQGVLQHGISGLIELTPPTTRFEHSVGVMMVIRRLGGSIEEQIAGLLHDVSHTAFSHVMDHVFDSAASQSYHDEVKAQYLIKTDLPQILSEHGFNWRDFLNEGNFPLLEQPSPRLCADRIDYFLRDALGFGVATHQEIEELLGHLTLARGRIALDDLSIAIWMGDTFIKTDDFSWSNFHEVGLYECTARALRYAFENDILDHDDIWLTDAVIWEKLCASPDPSLQRYLRPIRPDVRFEWDEENPEFVLSTKIRTIDPDVLIDGRLKPLSKWDTAFDQRRSAYVERKSGVWRMRQVG